MMPISRNVLRVKNRARLHRVGFELFAGEFTTRTDNAERVSCDNAKWIQARIYALVRKFENDTRLIFLHAHTILIGLTLTFFNLSF